MCKQLTTILQYVIIFMWETKNNYYTIRLEIKL